MDSGKFKSNTEYIATYSQVVIPLVLCIDDNARQ